MSYRDDIITEADHLAMRIEELRQRAPTKINCQMLREAEKKLASLLLFLQPSGAKIGGRRVQPPYPP